MIDKKNLIVYALNRKNNKEELKRLDEVYNKAIAKEKQYSKKSTAIWTDQQNMFADIILKDKLLNSASWKLVIYDFQIHSWHGNISGDFNRIRLEADFNEFETLKWLYSMNDKKYSFIIKFEISDDEGSLNFQVSTGQDIIFLEQDEIKDIASLLRIVKYLDLDITVDPSIKKVIDDMQEKTKILKELLKRFDVK